MSCFLRVSCYFQHLKKIGAKKNVGGGGGVNIFFLEKQFFLGGGGGGVLKIFFLEKQFFLISRFMLFSTLKKIYIEKSPLLTG